MALETYRQGLSIKKHLAVGFPLYEAYALMSSVSWYRMPSTSTSIRMGQSMSRDALRRNAALSALCDAGSLVTIVRLRLRLWPFTPCVGS